MRKVRPAIHFTFYKLESIVAAFHKTGICIHRNRISYRDNMRTELYVETLVNAAQSHDLRGAISHSGRGSQYTSCVFRGKLAKLGRKLLLTIAIRELQTAQGGISQVQAA